MHETTAAIGCGDATLDAIKASIFSFGKFDATGVYSSHKCILFDRTDGSHCCRSVGIRSHTPSVDRYHFLVVITKNNFLPLEHIKLWRKARAHRFDDIKVAKAQDCIRKNMVLLVHVDQQ